MKVTFTKFFFSIIQTVIVVVLLLSVAVYCQAVETPLFKEEKSGSSTVTYSYRIFCEGIIKTTVAQLLLLVVRDDNMTIPYTVTRVAQWSLQPAYTIAESNDELLPGFQYEFNQTYDYGTSGQHLTHFQFSILTDDEQPPHGLNISNGKVYIYLDENKCIYPYTDIEGNGGASGDNGDNTDTNGSNDNNSNTDTSNTYSLFIQQQQQSILFSLIFITLLLIVIL